MRELRFRAWDRGKKKMSKPFDFTQFCNECGGIAGGDFQFDECDFIQYTGLKDKNGKEIYEGDIVRQPSTEFTTSVSNMDGTGCFPFTEYPVEGFEVIGNIYENPELLDNK